GGTTAEIWNRIDVEIIHHVAGIVVDLDPLVIDFADDLGAGGTCARFAAVLLDDDRHAMVACHGTELLESFDPQPAVAAFGVAEREHLADAPGRRLPDAGFENAQGALSLGVDSGEHQERLEAHISTSSTQFSRPVRGRIRCNDGYGLPT